jgi:tRNA threonylcarbamoyladenosine biosynthesis protein TsaB
MTATLQTMLQAESLVPRNVTGVIVSRGPGSYTGLRVGLTTAKAFAYATGCELRAVDTFAAIAQQTPSHANHVWVVADALQGLVYAQRFEKRHDGWLAVNALQILAIGEFSSKILRGDFVSGPGVDVCASSLPGSCEVVPEEDRHPRIESLYKVGMWQNPLTKEELFALEPLYLRGSSAEEKANATTPRSQ